MTGLKYISFLETSGYGHAAMAYIRGLIRAGVPVTWHPMVAGKRRYEPYVGGATGDPILDAVVHRDIVYDTVLVHTIPEYYHYWRERERGKRMVGYTTWETTRLQEHWPPILNAMDLVLVPSRWNAAVFRRSGVTPPIRVIPHLHAPPAEAAAPLPDVDAPDFVLYTIGPWTERKAPWRTLEAYWRAFQREDPVLLVVKTDVPDWTRLMPAGFWRAIGKRVFTAHRALRSLERRQATPARVRLIAGSQPDALIHALHARGDCYVALPGAEGWSLGAFDAAGHGNPVIMTGFGGQLDYLSATDAHLVDYKLENVARSGHRPGAGSWAVPDVEQAATLMREVFENRTAARERGARLRQRVLNEFGEAVVTRRLLAALTDADRAAHAS